MPCTSLYILIAKLTTKILSLLASIGISLILILSTVYDLKLCYEKCQV